VGFQCSLPLLRHKFHPPVDPAATALVPLRGGGPGGALTAHDSHLHETQCPIGGAATEAILREQRPHGYVSPFPPRLPVVSPISERDL
jgi:hypothetical protein